MGGASRGCGSASGPPSCSAPRKPGEGRLPLSFSYLGHQGPLGFSCPVLAVTFTLVCHGDHTQSGQWFFLVFTERKGNLEGIPQKLQNARLLIAGYSSFQSLSLIQLVVHPLPPTTCGRQLSPDFTCLVSACLLPWLSFSVLPLTFPRPTQNSLSESQADLSYSPHLPGEVVCWCPFHKF